MQNSIIFISLHITLSLSQQILIYRCDYTTRKTPNSTIQQEVIPIPQYIPFTQEQKERAAATDLEAFLQSRREKLIRSGREKRLASDHSVTIRGGEWYDHAEQRGGNAISFLQRYYNMNFPDAVQALLGGDFKPAVSAKPEPKPFALPEVHSDMRRVFAYLTKTRGIDNRIVAAFAHDKLLYEDAKYHNAVFVGRDESGTPVHAHVRSTNSRGKTFRINVEGGDPRYSFHHIGMNGSLLVFEAPIDLLSHISLYPQNWQENSYVACCGTSILPVVKMLEQMPQADTVLLCMDNDEAGQKANRRMTEQLEAESLTVIPQIPKMKDWNDDLLAQHQYGLQLAGS
ncbi:MAG: DUF3991 and toprim domain-containing protein [Eubacteriales bacterium]|nr:DUF3991 and toprim domain-containing protein [Eubacteriales bacterium]